MPPGPEPAQPLYSQEDAEQVNRKFQPVMLYEQQLLAGSTKGEGFNMTL